MRACIHGVAIGEGEAGCETCSSVYYVKARRERIATAALSAMARSYAAAEVDAPTVAQQAVAYADALIAELDKP